MMRSMALEFQGDKNCRYLDKQYMLGDSLLVSPIFNEEGMAEYFLTEGAWTNYLTGETDQGGHWREERHGYLSVPLWVRENSVIPVQMDPQNALEDYSKKLELRVYALKEQADCVVYQDGGEILTAKLTRERDGIRIALKGKSGCRIRLVNTVLAAAEGAFLEIQGSDTLLTVEEPETTVICRL